MQKTYFIYNPLTRLVKIGKSTDPRDRISRIETMTGVKLSLLAVVDTDIERYLHEWALKYRVIGEWLMWCKEIKALLTLLVDTPLPPVQRPKKGYEVGAFMIDAGGKRR